MATHHAREFLRGSPAWAGIDPARDADIPLLAWFPRVGRDRPEYQAQIVELAEVPPRGRG